MKKSVYDSDDDGIVDKAERGIKLLAEPSDRLWWHVYITTACTSTTYTKLASVTIDSDFVGGSKFRVRFGLKSDEDGVTVYGRIYKNGSPYGTERSTTNGVDYEWFTEDLEFEGEDTCELWVKTSNSDYRVNAKDFDGMCNAIYLAK